MNKNLHRVIFNKARGIRMVVQETASSEGKASTASTQAGGTGDLPAGGVDPISSLRRSYLTPVSAA